MSEMVNVVGASLGTASQSLSVHSMVSYICFICFVLVLRSWSSSTCSKLQARLQNKAILQASLPRLAVAICVNHASADCMIEHWHGNQRSWSFIRTPGQPRLKHLISCTCDYKEAWKQSYGLCWNMFDQVGECRLEEGQARVHSRRQQSLEFFFRIIPPQRRERVLVFGQDWSLRETCSLKRTCATWWLMHGREEGRCCFLTFLHVQSIANLQHASTMFKCWNLWTLCPALPSWIALVPRALEMDRWKVDRGRPFHSVLRSTPFLELDLS